MLKIKSIIARQILDSRGNPTVEAELTLADGTVALAAAPSGASTGAREAAEKRDGDSAFFGRGVLRAVARINDEIAPALVGMDARDQQQIDDALIALDGTSDKSRCGANALLAASLSSKKAAALATNTPLYAAIRADYGNAADAVTLPTPLMNIINGGAHAANNLDIQEFMIVPHGFDSFADGLRAGVEIYHALKQILQRKKLATAVGDEGGFAPDCADNEAALQLLTDAISSAGYRPGEQVSIALDCAAGELFEGGVYHLRADGFAGDADALIELLAAWSRSYPIVSIEDGCDEDDRLGWRRLTERLGARAQIVGDDLFVTNPAILRAGIADGLANALLVKPNQIGTLSETLDAARVAQAAGYNLILSHRSGETEYTDIADIAVGVGAAQIKTGAPCRGERTAKYNRLLRIAEQVERAGARAQYGGDFARGGFGRGAQYGGSGSGGVAAAAGGGGRS